MTTKTIRTMFGSISTSGQFGTLTKVVPMLRAPCPATVWVRPGAGCTVRVEHSLDAGLTYTAWPSGDVTAYTENRLVSGVTHLRFSRTVGAVESTFGIN